MTKIIIDGQTYLAYACTAVPSPVEVECFELPTAERQPAILLQYGENRSKSVISWCDPSILTGRSVINGDGTDATDREFAFDIVLYRYGMWESDAILTAEITGE